MKRNSREKRTQESLPPPSTITMEQLAAQIGTLCNHLNTMAETLNTLQVNQTTMAQTLQSLGNQQQQQIVSVLPPKSNVNNTNSGSSSSSGHAKKKMKKDASPPTQSVELKDKNSILHRLCLLLRSIDYRGGIEVRIRSSTYSANKYMEWGDLPPWGSVIIRQPSIRYSPATPDKELIDFYTVMYQYNHTPTSALQCIIYSDLETALFEMVQSYSIIHNDYSMNYKDYDNYMVYARPPTIHLDRETTVQQEKINGYGGIPFKKLYSDAIWQGKEMLEFKRMPFHNIRRDMQIDERIAYYLIEVTKPLREMKNALILGNIAPISNINLGNNKDWVDVEPILRKVMFSKVRQITASVQNKVHDIEVFPFGPETSKDYPGDFHTHTGCGFAIVSFKNHDAMLDFQNRCARLEESSNDNFLIYSWIYESFLTRIPTYSIEYITRSEPLTLLERMNDGLPYPEHFANQIQAQSHELSDIVEESGIIHDNLEALNCIGKLFKISMSATPSPSSMTPGRFRRNSISSSVTPLTSYRRKSIGESGGTMADRSHLATFDFTSPSCLFTPNYCPVEENINLQPEIESPLEKNTIFDEPQIIEQQPISVPEHSSQVENRTEPQETITEMPILENKDMEPHHNTVPVPVKKVIVLKSRKEMKRIIC